MSRILPNLYIGDYDDATNHMMLHAKGITHVLNCAEELNSDLFANCFISKKLSFDDLPSQRLSPQIFAGYSFINNAVEKGGVVLVHCAAGISRSVSTAIYYLMRKYNMTYDEAYKLILKNRKIARPNAGFQRQLRELHRERQFDTSKRLIKKNKK